METASLEVSCLAISTYDSSYFLAALVARDQTGQEVLPKAEPSDVQKDLMLWQSNGLKLWKGHHTFSKNGSLFSLEQIVATVNGFLALARCTGGVALLEIHLEDLPDSSLDSVDKSQVEALSEMPEGKPQCERSTAVDHENIHASADHRPVLLAGCVGCRVPSWVV